MSPQVQIKAAQTLLVSQLDCTLASCEYFTIALLNDHCLSTPTIPLSSVQVHSKHQSVINQSSTAMATHCHDSLITYISSQLTTVQAATQPVDQAVIEELGDPLQRIIHLLGNIPDGDIVSGKLPTYKFV
jgi:hypothetical protein